MINNSNGDDGGGKRWGDSGEGDRGRPGDGDAERRAGGSGDKRGGSGDERRRLDESGGRRDTAEDWHRPSRAGRVERWRLDDGTRGGEGGRRDTAGDWHRPGSAGGVDRGRPDGGGGGGGGRRDWDWRRPGSAGGVETRRRDEGAGQRRDDLAADWRRSGSAERAEPWRRPGSAAGGAQRPSALALAGERPWEAAWGPQPGSRDPVAANSPGEWSLVRADPHGLRRSHEALWVNTDAGRDLHASSTTELQLTRGEAICLRRVRDALRVGDVDRAAFVAESVSNRSQAEWQRLFALLDFSDQQMLARRRLQPRPVGDGPTKSELTHVTRVKDLEVDSIIYRHHLNDLKYEIERINIKEDLRASSQLLPSMSQDADPVEEVRMRYENELSLLKQKNQAHPTRESAMQSRCETLESQLKKANNEISFLKDQVHGLRVQLGVWPDRVTQLEEENATLKEQLSDCRSANQQCRRELRSTQDRLQEALHQQQFTSPQGSESRLNASDHRLLQRVLEDYEVLQREHDRVRAALADTEGRLYEARSESSESAKQVAALQKEVQRLEADSHALRRRSLYEPPRSCLSAYNGLKDRDVSPTASLRMRSSSRPSLLRETSLDRQTVADLPRVDDNSPDDKTLTGMDIMTMSLPPSAFAESLCASSTRESRPHSPPVRLHTGGRHSTGPPSYHDVRMMELQYDQLQHEKRRLEAALSHLPARALNPRMRRECRQEKERLEASLEATDRQIGSLRMTLRQFNVLKSSV